MVETSSPSEMSNSVFWLLKAEAFLLYHFCIKVDYCGITESSWKPTFGRGTKLILQSGTPKSKLLFHIIKARLRFSFFSTWQKLSKSFKYIMLIGFGFLLHSELFLSGKIRGVQLAKHPHFDWNLCGKGGICCPPWSLLENTHICVDPKLCVVFVSECVTVWIQHLAGRWPLAVGHNWEWNQVGGKPEGSYG